MNIFKEMVLSIYDFKSYKKFLENKKSKVFLFSVVLMFFYFMLTIGIPFARFQMSIGGLAALAEESIPDFELKNGELWIDGEFEYEDYNTWIYANTESGEVFYSAFEMVPYLNEYSDVLLLDSEKLIIKNEGMVQEIYFEDIGIDFTKENLLSYLPLLYAIITIIFVVMYIFMTAFFFVGVLFVALIGMIVASAMNYKLTFGQLYLLSVYARTLPLIIKAVYSHIPVKIPFFWVINFGISVLYIGLAIQKMGNDNLDNGEILIQSAETTTSTGWEI